ncbi:MAG: CDP-glycerol glycerophosphotransferase family protein, partial [Propionibacteriaceae bacterium]|nr:CDP-glycerol glycerophosphotransferase family protein [Propionibacteriaceae bacterium]
IWLYYDKLYKGGDNGEYLFRQAAKRADGITHCYVIDHSTRYYRRLRRDGYRHLLRPNSLWLRLHTLNAEQFCVTHRNKLRYLGFKVHGRQFFANLVRAKTVATSHGLVIDHVPKSAGQQRDNAVLHFCASPRERDALLLPDYGFAAANVKLLGIPRFDGLRDEQRDFVLLAPTWRVGVLPPMAEGDDRYLDTFPETAYFQTFNALIHHPALLDGLARRGRRLKFLLHPVFAANKPHFQPPPGVDVIRGDTEADYVELMSRAAVMVTDYSGIQYDFAYLRKPLVYYHPPELPHHYKPSQVFSYDEDAFGPVLTNPDDVVAEALAAVDRGEPTAEHRARMNAFFAFDDRGNAERIYQALIASSQPAGRRS